MAERIPALNILKRFSLAGLGPDWQDCYVSYHPMAVGDLIEIQGLDTQGLNEKTGVNFILEHVKKHVAGGKLSVIDDSGAPAIQDLQPGHVDLLPVDIIQKLFTEMVGAVQDPKDTPSAAPSADETKSDTPPTETSSSTD